MMGWDGWQVGRKEVGGVGVWDGCVGWVCGMKDLRGARMVWIG